MNMKLPRALLLAALLSASAMAHAAYPDRPIHMVVPFSAGGSNDIVARLVGQQITDALGQPVVTENRPGASGTIGVNAVAKSVGDGYTLLTSSGTPIAASPYLYKKLPYDPAMDFAPIIRIASQPAVLMVKSSLPAANVKELIALAKKSPGKLTFGSGGVGSTEHMAAVRFMMLTGVEMTHVPYKGGAPAMTDLIGGQVDMMFATAPSAMPYIKSDKLRTLGVTTLKRSPLLAGVPTISEAGVDGYESVTWIGLFAPAALPGDVVRKLNGLVQKALGGDLNKKLGELGLDAAGGSPEEFAAFIRKDSKNYEAVIKAAKITPQ